MGKILVIEDEEHIQRVIEVILKRDGHQVFKAMSGEEALDLLAREEKSEQTDLVLLDIMLSGMDGLHVLKKIKSSENTRNISVIMMTAVSHEDIVVKGIKLGADLVIKIITIFLIIWLSIF